MTSIRDQNVLITGSAKGMGREMAREFGEKGADVVLVDIDEPALEETADSLGRRGVDATPIVADLADKSAIDELPGRVRDRVGPVDVLVNNAGIVQGGHFEEMDDAADELTLAVNVMAVHWMTKRFLPQLKRGRDTHIVQMASAAGFVGLPYQITYSASKWFVIGLSESLRLELDDRGYDDPNITIVCPSLVDTGMFEGSEPPMLSPLLDPDFVAERVVESVREENLYVKEPTTVKLIPHLRALLPVDVVDFLMDKLGVTSLMHGFEGRDDPGLDD